MVIVISLFFFIGMKTPKQVSKMMFQLPHTQKLKTRNIPINKKLEFVGERSEHENAVFLGTTVHLLKGNIP